MNLAALHIELDLNFQSLDGCLALRSPTLQHLVLMLIWFSTTADQGDVGVITIIRFPSEVHLVSIVLLEENQITYLKLVGGSQMQVVSFQISPHPLQHLSCGGKSDSGLLNSLPQCAITLIWFDTLD